MQTKAELIAKITAMAQEYKQIKLNSRQSQAVKYLHIVVGQFMETCLWHNYRMK
jgi:hypothetical protein